MAAQKGKDILIKIGDGAMSEAFTTVAGIRARTVSLNAKTVDATDSDSDGRWRELLAGAGGKVARRVRLRHLPRRRLGRRHAPGLLRPDGWQLAARHS